MKASEFEDYLELTCKMVDYGVATELEWWTRTGIIVIKKALVQTPATIQIQTLLFIMSR